jgi:L-rhamnose mutarotase
MKTVKSLLLLAAFVLSSFMLVAQNTETTFFIVETMKSAPGKTDEYVKAEREVWKRIHQERIKQGLILGWNLYAVRSPSGTSAPYDYVTVTLVQGWNKLENPWGTMWASGLEKLLTKEQLAVANGTSSLRDLTNSTVFYGADFVAADPKNTTPAKYQMINYMKIKEGMWDEYMNMETQLVKPMHVEMMKSGGRSAWGLYGRAFGGTHQPFDFVTSDFYNKWADMNASGDYNKALEKVHPKMSMSYLEKRINESRNLVNQEMWELIDYAQ